MLMYFLLCFPFPSPTTGHTLMLMDCEHQAGTLLQPLIHHANTVGWKAQRNKERELLLLIESQRYEERIDYILFIPCTTKKGH